MFALRNRDRGTDHRGHHHFVWNLAWLVLDTWQRRSPLGRQLGLVLSRPQRHRYKGQACNSRYEQSDQSGRRALGTTFQKNGPRHGRLVLPGLDVLDVPELDPAIPAYTV